MGDYRTTIGESLPPPPRRRRFRLYAWLLSGLALTAALAIVGSIVQVDRYVLATGYVTAEEYAEVRPPVSGMVAEILVDSGGMVERGEILVRLDSSREQAALSEAQAQLRRTEAEASRRRIEIAEQQRELTGEIAVLQMRLENASRGLTRARELAGHGLIAESRLEDLELRESILRAELASLKNRDPSLFEQELVVVECEVEAWRDRVEAAELRMRERHVRAPIGGQALRYEFVIGELVRPETVLLELFGGTRKIMKLKIDERFAAIVAPGQSYQAVLAPYRRSREVVFEGEVESLRNVIQGDGTRNYRIAYCSFQPDDLNIPPGTTGEARIYYGRSSLWRFLLGLR